MRKYLLSLSISFFLFSANIISQIPNGDFNNWAADSLGRLDPVGWTSTNLVDSGVVIRDVDHTGGSGYSVELRIAYDSIQGYYESGSVGLVHAPFSGSVRPSKLTGYWNIYNPHTTDQIFVELELYNSSNVQIGSGNYATPVGFSFINWTPFTDTLTYTSNDPVASYTITLFYFALSNDTAIYSHFDDLAFDVSTGIDANEQSHPSFNILRSNEGYILEVEKKRPGSLKVNVVDENGRNVMNIYNGSCSEGKLSLEINLNSLSTGMYFCRVETEDKYKVFRICRN